MRTLNDRCIAASLEHRLSMSTLNFRTEYINGRLTNDRKMSLMNKDELRIAIDNRIEAFNDGVEADSVMLAFTICARFRLHKLENQTT